MAPQESQAYRFKNLTENKTYLFDKIEVYGRLTKEMKRFNTFTSIADTGVITSTVITGGVPIAAFANVVGLAVEIALSRTSLLFSLATVITQNSFKIFIIKQEKLGAIKLLAQCKLDSIADIISQAMQDGYISSIEFHRVIVIYY